MRSHFLHMLLYSSLVAVFFAVLMRHTLRDRLRLGALIRLAMVGGALLPSQVFGQDMIDAGVGSVINIASMSGIIPLSRVVAYSAAKAAVINLTMWLAREWATTGVRVNAISPGIIDTPIFDRLGLDEEGLAGLKSALADQVPAGRMGLPEEVARVAVFLASEDSSYMTGCEIPVSGGLGQL